MKKQEMIQKAVYSCAILILLFVIGYSGLQILESAVLYHGQTEYERTLYRGFYVTPWKKDGQWRI